MTPFGPLRFLYVGCKDTGEAAKAWEAAGCRKAWHFRAFGAEVAAFETGPGPLLLLADHRPPGSVLPVYEVADLVGVRQSLQAAGWSVRDPGFEIPNGPCLVASGAPGVEVALFEDQRPGAMESSYVKGNPNAVF